MHIVDLELVNQPPEYGFFVWCTVVYGFFLVLLRERLKRIVKEWNEHIISNIINACPPGRPDTMCFLPHLYNHQVYSDPSEDDGINNCWGSTQLFSWVWWILKNYCDKQRR